MFDEAEVDEAREFLGLIVESAVWSSVSSPFAWVEALRLTADQLEKDAVASEKEFDEEGKVEW